MSADSSVQDLLQTLLDAVKCDNARQRTMAVFQNRYAR